MPGRTEPMGSTTIATEISGDAPMLRPRRTVRCRARVLDGHGATEPPVFSVTFHEAAVWDVARISTKLELRRYHDPRPRFRTDQRFASWCELRVWLRFVDREASMPTTTAVLYGDERAARE